MNILNAFNLLEDITAGKVDYLEEYKKYIIEHKANVTKFADWLVENLPDLFDGCDVDMFYDIIEEHDESKFSEEEFEPYAKKFYGPQDISGKPLAYVPGYDEAWKHHWTHNEHHPEFWLGEDMPYIYILEMICDWGSFGMKTGNLRELSDFYYNKAKDDEEKNLSDNTKEIIEEILDKINSRLDEQE